MRIQLNASLRILERSAGSRSLIWLLAVKNLRARYAGTSAGLLWSCVQPLMTILTYCFIFSFAFKVRPEAGVSYLLFFLCGFIPWFFFSDVLLVNVSAVAGSPHLVKQTVFPVELLAVANLVTGAIIHGIMVLILLCLILLDGRPASWGCLQFLYYFAGLATFLLGLSWLLAALNVFCRDVSFAAGVVLNLWFWITPIAWFADMLAPRWRILVKLNPMYYVVEGYRASFIGHQPFWAHHWRLGLYYWGVSLILWTAGGVLFEKLKPEFADVL